MGSKPIPQPDDDAPFGGETLHETVLDGGHVIIRSRFKPGDFVLDEDGDRTEILRVRLDQRGRAVYDYSITDADFFYHEEIARADRLWTLDEFTNSPRSGPMPASHEEMLALGLNPYTGAPLDDEKGAA